MSDLPKAVYINEEGPREGFQIEKGDILCYHSPETGKIEEKAIILNTADGQTRVACDRHNLKLAHRDAQDFFGGVF